MTTPRNSPQATRQEDPKSLCWCICHEKDFPRGTTLDAECKHCKPSTGGQEEMLQQRLKEIRGRYLGDSWKREGSWLLRNGDAIISIEDNNMSVYEDCKFVQRDDQCSCYDDAQAFIREMGDVIEHADADKDFLFSRIASLQSQNALLRGENEKMRDALIDIKDGKGNFSPCTNCHDTNRNMLSERARVALSSLP